jgi:hypothetical protein
MLQMDFPSGGWVFSASSIAWNGTLADPTCSTIMANVMAAATD